MTNREYAAWAMQGLLDDKGEDEREVAIANVAGNRLTITIEDLAALRTILPPYRHPPAWRCSIPLPLAEMTPRERWRVVGEHARRLARRLGVVMIFFDEPMPVVQESSAALTARPVWLRRWLRRNNAAIASMPGYSGARGSHA